MKAAGFIGDAGDCACRALAIATGMPYKEVYDLINQRAKTGRKGSKRAKSSAREGVYHNQLMKPLMLELGWKWNPTMQIGSGCKVHMRADELPSGTIICRVSKHFACVKDGVLYDTGDCSRNGTRCVYGYYSKES